MKMPDIVLPVTMQHIGVATAMLIGFMVVMFLGAMFLPAIRKEGFPQPDGARKNYKLTGLFLFLLTTAFAIGLPLLGGSLTPILKYFWSLFIVTNIIAFVWAFALFYLGRRAKDYKPNTEQNLPVWLHDIWFGPTLNPTWFGVDLKMWAYQPSLCGWFLIVAAFGHYQYETTQTLTPQMVLFISFVWLYLFTHYIREDFMLSTWDIIAENFGLMLTWGDLVYVPYFYSICGWFLLASNEPMATIPIILLILFHGLGHWIFRGANWQKDAYKRDPEAHIWGKKAETINGRILISGWWGIGRKINYTGEIMVYFSFALCTGFQSWIPYILPFSLVLLLFQRAMRDEKKCSKKYGDVWVEYRKKAKFRIVPFLF